MKDTKDKKVYVHPGAFLGCYGIKSISVASEAQRDLITNCGLTRTYDYDEYGYHVYELMSADVVHVRETTESGSETGSETGSE